MKSSGNGLSTPIKVLVIVTICFDLLDLIFFKQSFSIYKEKYEFLAIFWFGLDHLITLIELAVVFPFFRLKDWARKALIGVSCYSIFSGFRLLIYTVMGAESLTTKEAFVSVASGFIAFLVGSTIPTLLIYFLQSSQTVRVFGRPGLGSRDFLFFDLPLAQSQRGLKIKRLVAASIDLILYPLVFGIMIGTGLVSVEAFSRNQVLSWINFVGNALVWRDYIFSPGRYFLNLRLVTIGNEAPVMICSSRFGSNLVRVILRNLFLLIPFVLIVGYAFEIIMVLITGNRFSDRIAGTTVKKVGDRF